MVCEIAVLSLLRSMESLKPVADSRWRRDRLLILCYHGISLEDEHDWRPAFYFRTAGLGTALQTLRATR